MGVELDALSKGLSINNIAIASAFPKVGRTVKDGMIYINDVLASETDFANDPKNPILSAEISSYLNLTQNDAIQLFTPDKIDNIQQYPLCKKNRQYLIFDSESDNSLESIAKQLENRENILFVGCGGFAEYLHFKRHNPVLFISGSANRVTHDQINYLMQHSDIQSFSVKPEKLSQNTINKTELVSNIQKSLAKKQSAILYIAKSEKYTHDISLSNNLVGFLSDVVKGVLSDKSIELSALFLTGGDTAMQILRANGIERIQIENELEPAIPYGRVIDKDIIFKIITKSGGLGRTDCLTSILDIFESSEETRKEA
ncbi:hypothetical protein CI610_03545 [invertebrate metagenome]|uniref:Four-carbon acid sugar kinase nucleotide binding domain-containing protein n=1 Tax=invertebrate metagenome TaxID=1711999 RepID=A0A2H9T2W1_9ZZZZ